MKKLFLIFCLIFSLISYSQEQYTFKSGGRIFENDKEISPTDLRAKFSKNTKFLELYNAGRTKKTLGNIMLYGGLATLTGKLLLDLTTDNERTVTYGSYYGSINVDQKRSTITGYLIGGGLVLASIPVKIGFSKKIRKAVELLNSDVKSADVGFFDSESVILDSNGVGLRVTF